jgi:hypothetical protein
MKRTLLLAILFLSVHSSAQNKIQTPPEFLGFEVGADRKLADYKQISDYLRALDAASGRLEVRSLGKTTLGADMIMAVVSSEENIRNLEKYREIARKLADPRGLTPAQIDGYVREGKLILLVTCNIHATEIGSSQMAMEWAHQLVTAQDPTTKQRLNDVILLLVPSLNPDGQTMVTEWYRKHVGTKFEGGMMPYLYHHYVGHDNNRDWYMLTQKETQNVSRAVYQEWFPQFWLDEHQMGSNGPRIYVPPNADPVAKLVHPLVHRGNNLLGSNMAWRLEEAGKSGVVSSYVFDAYWIGGTRNTGWWKNMFGVLTEVASARIASPLDVAPTELEGGGKGLVDYRQQVNFPNPWPGGTWRLRDIMDYELIISNATLESTSKYREDFLRGVARMAQDAVRSATPGECYRISLDGQRDPATALRLVALLKAHNVEILRSKDNRTFLIPLAQPYGKFVREMLDVQRYPEVKPAAGSGILEPYDVTTWSLPLMMGVEVAKTSISAQEQGTFVPLSNQPSTEPVPTRSQRKVGIYKPFVPSMDEGWTRFILEQRKFNVKSIENPAIKSGKLNDNFDVIIVPDIGKDIILEGKPQREGYWEELPPDYAGGIGKDGAKTLKTFVENGGTLITLAKSAELVISEFNLPVKNPLLNAKDAEFNAPGTLLRVLMDPKHPVTSGMTEAAAFVDAPIYFQTSAPTPDVGRTVLAWYPDDQRDILLSGWIHGAEKLERKAAAVAFTLGKGRIVMFGFRPQHRAQTEGTFPLLFNAIDWEARAQR